MLQYFDVRGNREEATKKFRVTQDSVAFDRHDLNVRASLGRAQINEP
jgi:hypothetical protein